MKRLVWASLLTATAVLPACSPWDYGKGDFFAGTVDAANYPSFYTGGTVEKQAGTLKGITAFVSDGSTVTTYNLAMPDDQVDQGAGAADILGFTVPEFALATEEVAADLDDGNGPTVLFDPATPAQAFSFDAAGGEPFSSPPKCVAPKNYVFDARLESYRLDLQGPIFSAIPQKAENVGQVDPIFVPYWAEVAVQSKGEPCQQLKDEDRLRESKLVTVPITPADGSAGSVPTPTPSGKFLAWFPIDPRTDVTPETPLPAGPGFGAQKWGWYKHFLFAYIDGGYIPTQQYSFDIGATNPLEFTGFRTQRWYYPDQRPGAASDGMGGFTYPKTTAQDCDPTSTDTSPDLTYCYQPTGPGLPTLKASYADFVTDKLDAARGDEAYSPICELCPYEGSDSDWDAFFEGNNIPLFSNIANATCTGTYVYCPQQRATN